jgi:hypothetical protein
VPYHTVRRGGEAERRRAGEEERRRGGEQESRRAGEEERREGGRGGAEGRDEGEEEWRVEGRMSCAHFLHLYPRLAQYRERTTVHGFCTGSLLLVQTRWLDSLAGVPCREWVRKIGSSMAGA